MYRICYRFYVIYWFFRISKKKNFKRSKNYMSKLPNRFLIDLIFDQKMGYAIYFNIKRVYYRIIRCMEFCRHFSLSNLCGI